MEQQHNTALKLVQDKHIDFDLNPHLLAIAFFNNLHHKNGKFAVEECKRNRFYEGVMTRINSDPLTSSPFQEWLYMYVIKTHGGIVSESILQYIILHKSRVPYQHEEGETTSPQIVITSDNTMLTMRVCETRACLTNTDDMFFIQARMRLLKQVAEEVSLLGLQTHQTFP
jgi:hypothetical protein